MKIAFHGAARTVTGSKHLVTMASGKKILLDCGMFQGLGRDTLKLNSEFGFDPSELAHVIISHAHIDHIGLLPKLVKEGYKGDIYMTPPTADLAKILLLDSARIQEEDVRFINRDRERQGRENVEPLYTEEDAKNVFPHIKLVDYNEHFKVADDIDLMYTDCGHILGSAAINLVLKEKGKDIRITFSGDVGRYRDMLLKSPEPFPQADFILIESTYGDKLHDMVSPATDKIFNYIVDTCLKKKGKLIIPAFSVGRTQEILYILNRLSLEDRLPPLSYYVDSPLSIEATEIIKKHPECFNKDVREVLSHDEDVFSFPGLQYVRTAQESIALNSMHEPCVIISASGMAEAGRVKHHIAHNIEKESSTILIVGYCEPHSLGGRLSAGAQGVHIYGQPYQVKADVGVIRSMSAHGDYEDLSQWLACQDPREVQKLFIVHGEYDVQLNFKERLIRKGFRDVEVPALHQEIGLGI
jgi:metallo-beta-lactamase family protein